MKMKNKIQPALLTRTEIEWLLNNVKISKSYEYRIKSDIRKKIKSFTDLEVPLLIQKGIIDLSIFAQNLMGNPQSGVQNISQLNSSHEICAQNKSLGRDLDPGPLPYQGNALPG